MSKASGMWRPDGSKFAEEVENTWTALVAHADEMRRRNHSPDDTVITVELPYNPSLANVFEAVKARQVPGSLVDVRLVDPVRIVRSMVMRSQDIRERGAVNWWLWHDWIAAGWDAGYAGCVHPSATLKEAREQGWVADPGDADLFREGFGLFRVGKGRPTVRG